MRTKKILFLLIGSLLILNSCKREGCMDPNATNYDAKAKKDDGSCIHEEDYTSLKITIHPNIGDDHLAFNTNYTNSEGRTYQFSTAKFYMSGIHIKGSTHKTGHGGDFDDVYILNKGIHETEEIGEIEPGSYSGIKFYVGVDSFTNYTKQPTDFDVNHALGSNANMYWTWNSGYIYLMLEGMVDTNFTPDGTVDASFAFHIGKIENLKQVDIDYEFEVVDGTDKTINIAVDFSKFIEGVDFTNPSLLLTHSNNPGVDTVIANNIISAFSIE